MRTFFLFFNPQGIPDWFIAHKLPVFDREGIVIGVMGTSQSYAEAKTVLQPYIKAERYEEEPLLAMP